MTFHAHDCAPCDATRQIVDALTARWDPLDNWADVNATTGNGTLRDEALDVVAGVLHQLPLGGAP